LVAAASFSMEAGLLKQHWIPWAASTCCNRLQAVLRVTEQRAQVSHRGSAYREHRVSDRRTESGGLFRI
jgi:hypothetical protein